MKILPPIPDVLNELHRRMNMQYPFPNLNDELFVAKVAVGEENGTTVGGAAVRLVGEAFIWLDPQVPVLKRLEAIGILHERLKIEAYNQGLEQVSAWIPPTCSDAFIKAIEALGWKKSPWANWTINL